MEVSIEEIQKIAEMLPGDTIVYRMEDGLKRIYYTKNVPDLFGYTREEYEAQKNENPYQLILESDQYLVQSKVKQCLTTNEDVTFVFRFKHKTDGHTWVHANARVIGALDHAPLLAATFFDISEEMNNRELIIESSNRAVVVFDKIDREVLYGNTQFFKIAGVSKEMCLGSPCNEVVCGMGEWNPEKCTCFQIMESGTSVETYDEKHDRTFRMSTKKVLWGEHDAVVFYMEDVTESKRKDAEIRQQNMQLQKVQEEAIQSYRRQLDAVMSMNRDALSTFQMNITKNTCTNGLSPYENLLKLQEPGTVDGYFEAAKRFVPADEMARIEKAFVRDYLLECFAEKQTSVYVDCHFYMSEKDRRYIRTKISMAENPVSHDIEGIIYTLDLTERERDIQIMQQLFEKQYEGIDVIDAKWHTYSLIQFAYDEKLGDASQILPYEEGVERLVNRFVPEEEREAYREKAALDTICEQLEEKGVYTFISHFYDQNGQKRLKKVSYYFMDSMKEKILAVIEDVTEITLKEQERMNDLRQALLVAEQATEAKNTFFSNMSHDMRTPLNGVLGFTALGQAAETIEEKDEYLDKINTSGQFLLQLINDTLDLSKMESNKMQLYPNVYAISEIADAIKCAVEESAKEKGVELFIDDSCMQKKNVRVDKMRLMQVFVNLLGNAIKFTSKGGQVRLNMECLNPPVDGANCKVTVYDTGCGISKEFMPYVFEPFSQQGGLETQKVMGTGLGLAVVKQIVDLMQGRIELQSEYGKWTEFTVYLPIDVVENYEKQEVHIEESIDLTGKRILMCEDHPINQELAVRLLEREGMQVVVAANGKIGVETFTGSELGYFDAILMDIRMPVMDGLEAAAAIRHLQRPDAATIPIIAMTANAFDSDRQASLQAGMNAHLAKPIVPAEMYRELAKAVQGKKQIK